MNRVPADGPVLLCYDGSPSSATAIAVAGRLLAGREALICHAWAGLSSGMLGGDPGALPERLRRSAQELDDAGRAAAARIAAEGAQLASAAGFASRPLPVREERKTWRTLLAAASRHQASVVVAGARGRSSVGSAVLGSVSTALVQHSARPLLVVPISDEDAAGGPLLLCYDGSGSGRRAIEGAGALLAQRDAVVLNFWQSWMAEAPAPAGASKSARGMAVELDDAAGAMSAERTAAGVELARLTGFEARGLSQRATGPAWLTVVGAAAQHACAAVVVGSRGIIGLSAALGSVSHGVVHNSRLPVLVVPGARPGDQ